MALPGLEPGFSRAVEDRLAHSEPTPREDSGTCDELSEIRGALWVRLPAARCSNVASAFRTLLEHAKQQGIDANHPSVRAASSALEELEMYVASRGASGSPAPLTKELEQAE